MPNINYEEKEIVKSLIREIYIQIDDPQITRSALQKIVFLYTRVVLPQDRIKQILPFYWFYKGPISDEFQIVYDEMLMNHELIKIPKAEDNNIYIIRNHIESKPKIDNTWSIDRSRLHEITKEYIDNGFEALLEKCYNNHAPFMFGKLYNIKFRKQYDNLYRAILSDNEQEWKPAIPTVCKLLEDCVNQLPSNIEFNLYNYYFKMFYECFVQALRSKKFMDDDTIRKNFSTHTNELRNDLWKNFEEILRTLDIGHDKCCENRINDWKIYANETLQILSPFLYFYYDYVKTHFESDTNKFTTKLKDEHTESVGEKHISLVLLEWMAKSELPNIGFEWEIRHINSGCELCNKNLSIYKELT